MNNKVLSIIYDYSGKGINFDIFNKALSLLHKKATAENTLYRLDDFNFPAMKGTNGKQLKQGMQYVLVSKSREEVKEENSK
ncbi:hypothetical protein IAI10_02995 [Clostridium sp. 19966]|uniref:hypothetical protein n=1 Tax=Clostridium sp. 19966 TaxID=2768166 RepID=UPI0028DF74D5|nr:hypothetical protein [Clostridium sp. 19966]MDT8715625.1 hypothetical protein [Clostridium sp. 19966]